MNFYSLGNSFLVFLFFSCFCVSLGSEDDLGNGFGDMYDWAGTLEDGLARAKDENKPMMLIIHKSWCGACKALAPKFAGSKEILDLSHNFVMVNLIDDDEPTEKKYKPDGGYIPRILFLSPSGDVLTKIYNKLGNQDYKFYYAQIDSIILAMRKVNAMYVQTSSEKLEL